MSKGRRDEEPPAVCDQRMVSRSCPGHEHTCAGHHFPGDYCLCADKRCGRYFSTRK